MEQIGKDNVTGGGGNPGISLIMKGGYTGSTAVQVGVIGNVRSKNEGGGGNSFGVPI